ncbi:hypothetical protein [Natronococcus sp. A-GB7]|uniref:hypothetical protein n=1 Tax=Natronococcus sp. A-GB7 TaxID=3037649 RepID=UPI00241FEBB9|nr:hypothetical protein [Natronococcus sp. A-GB7]MDG5818553.1 hypothetical protein [Natronococcus sp. A-GB7]
MASLETTQERTRSEIAAYLRQFADELDPQTRPDAAGRGENTTETVGTGSTETTGTETGIGDETNRRDDATTGDRDRAESVGDKVTVITGNESATINPPQTCAFDVAVDTDSDLLDTGAERSTTFTIRWDADHVEADDELRVE